MFVCKKKRDLD